MKPTFPDFIIVRKDFVLKYVIDILEPHNADFKDTLMEPHDSKPYNPDIANVFYRAGFIENWGQGIQKICDEC
ncbi:MAG: hypothetical protein K2O16_02870 [Lachnospiraceae bacterium]|nr:hypothetical protein [Lachnospiraceae bacterium]